MPKVYRFRKFDIGKDDYITSSRMATKKRIKELGAEILPETEMKVDDTLLKDGLTGKNFDPTKP
jgi:hypothetical protein